jgi:hypothetical protein
LPRTRRSSTVEELVVEATFQVKVTDCESPAGIPETAAVTVTGVGVPLLMPRDAAVMEPVVQVLAGSPVTKLDGVAGIARGAAPPTFTVTVSVLVPTGIANAFPVMVTDAVVTVAPLAGERT